LITKQPPHRCFGIGRLPTHPLREIADAFGDRSMARCSRREPLTRRLTL
jgi:hypothetical protein